MTDQHDNPLSLQDMVEGRTVPYGTPSPSELDTLLEHVDTETAGHVAHFYDHREGYQPGSFITALIKTIAAADPSNRARLALGFPGYVGAMTACTDHPGGLARVVELSRRRG